MKHTLKAQLDHLAIDEIKEVLEEYRRSYPGYYALLYTFIGIGARKGELFALTKNDINLEENYIRISINKKAQILKYFTSLKNLGRVGNKKSEQCQYRWRRMSHTREVCSQLVFSVSVKNCVRAQDVILEDDFEKIGTMPISLAKNEPYERGMQPASF